VTNKYTKEMSELTGPVEVLLLPCVSTSTEKLVRCVVIHSTLLPTLIVDTPSSDQEFLYNYNYPLNNCYTTKCTYFLGCQKTHLTGFVISVRYYI